MRTHLLLASLVSVASTVMACSAAPSPVGSDVEATTAATPAKPLPALIFSLSQGWASDLVSMAGTARADAALLSTISVLKAYQAKYDTYALINPQTGNKAALIYVLDVLTQNGVKFVFDVYSSDTLGGPSVAPQNQHLGGLAPLNTPVAPQAGIALWPYAGNPADTTNPSTLMYYVANYPQTFRGLRVHEPEWVLSSYVSLGWPLSLSVPGSAEDLIRQFVQFAQQHGLWVEYNSTSFGYPSGTTTNGISLAVANAVTDTAATLLVQYPGIVYPTWPTNDGTNILRLSPANGLASWESLVSSLLPAAAPYPPSWGSRGLGLSDQSWMTGAGSYTEDSMPPSYLSSMAEDAVAHSASIIQFEPYWYFFNWADASQQSWTVPNPSAIGTGAPSADGCAVAEALNITPPGCE